MLITFHALIGAHLLDWVQVGVQFKINIFLTLTLLVLINSDSLTWYFIIYFELALCLQLAILLDHNFAYAY